MESSEPAQQPPFPLEDIGKICVICPIKSYLAPEEIHKAERTNLKRKGGVDNCNRYAKKRKMNLHFKVCIYLLYLRSFYLCCVTFRCGVTFRCAKKKLK